MESSPTADGNRDALTNMQALTFTPNFIFGKMNHSLRTLSSSCSFRVLYFLILSSILREIFFNNAGISLTSAGGFMIVTSRCASLLEEL